MRTPRVEKNIPIPPVGYGRKNHAYPWKQMQVGDSFLVRREPGEMKKTFNNLTKCRKVAQQTTGFKFEFRTVRQGLRVWRTA